MIHTQCTWHYHTNPAINIIIEYLGWQSIFWTILGLAVDLHVSLLVLFTWFGDIHQVVWYALAVQYHGDPLLAFLHLQPHIVWETKTTKQTSGRRLSDVGVVRAPDLPPCYPICRTCTLSPPFSDDIIVFPVGYSGTVWATNKIARWWNRNIVEDCGRSSI